MSRQQHKPKGASDAPTDFRDVALRIAFRLVESAVWNGDHCTWVFPPAAANRSNDHRLPPARPAGGELYTGTAGIGLFLLNVYSHTEEPAVRRTLDGAIAHAISSAHKLPANAFGFYSGRVGIAYVAARSAVLLGNNAHLENASSILSPLSRNESVDVGIDVIAGAGGAIAPLLLLSDMLQSDRPRVIARRLGDNLLRIARHEPRGWSWTLAEPNAAVRNLTGYAHGAAGIGCGLLELFSDTNDLRYLYGAEQAFVYEQSHFDNESQNWLDFRHPQLMTFIYEHGLDALATFLREGGKLEPYRPSGMRAWCHGAPGIALSRLRAFELTRDECYRDEAVVAVRSTLESLNAQTNFSLCHGTAGNCDILLEAADVLDDPVLRTAAIQYASDGAAHYEMAANRWPTGGGRQTYDPTLLLGEAGIGQFFLRLHDRAVPSCLLFRAAESRSNDLNRQVNTYLSCRIAYATEHFARSISAVDSIQRTRPNVLSEVFSSASDRGSDDVGAVYRCICRRIEEETDLVKRSWIEDATRIDRCSYELALTQTDHTDWVWTLVSPQEALTPDCQLRLSARVSFALVEHDWSAVQFDRSSTWTPPPHHRRYYLLHARGSHTEIREVSTFAYALLTMLADAGSARELCTRLTHSAESVLNVESAAYLLGKTLEQLRSALRARIVEPVSDTEPVGRGKLCVARLPSDEVIV